MSIASSVYPWSKGDITKSQLEQMIAVAEVFDLEFRSKLPASFVFEPMSQPNDGHTPWLRISAAKARSLVDSLWEMLTEEMKLVFQLLYFNTGVSYVSELLDNLSNLGIDINEAAQSLGRIRTIINENDKMAPAIEKYRSLLETRRGQRAAKPYQEMLAKNASPANASQ